MIFSTLFSVAFFIKIYFSKNNSISKLLYKFFFILSILSFFHLDININSNVSANNFLNFSFILGLLIILIDGFKNYTKIDSIELISLTSFQKKIISIITIFGVIAFIFNTLLVYAIIDYQAINEIAITALKNDSGADLYFKSNYPRFIRTFTHFTSPFGYLFLCLHFYFLSKNKLKLVLLYGILSLIIPLHGMQGLSRAAPAQYILLYFFMYYYVNKSFSVEIKKKFNFFLRLITILIVVSFLYTSYTRFSDAFFYVNLLGSETSPIELISYSFIDYLTQWIPYGIDSLNYYNLNFKFVYSNFKPLFNYITGFLGFDIDYDPNHFYNIYGGYTSKFIGLIPTLIFDMGYILSFVFVLIFRVIIYKKNTSKTISFSNLVKIPIFLSLILMSFANAWLAYLLYHIAIIYTFIAFFFFKFKIYFNKTA